MCFEQDFLYFDMSIAEHYRIIQKLGNQSQRKFGETYLVEHKETSIKGILKSVKKQLGREIVEDRLRREAQFTFELKGLPQILEFYESDSELLLIRAFIQGKQIDEYWQSLKRKEQVPFLISFLEKLVPLFTYLNQHSIVHCDIKPSNLIIETNGNDFDVHLIDFGLALNLLEGERRSTLFPLGYAAPELLLNHLDLVDQRSDLFALGILIWRLFSGKLPLCHANPSIFTNLQLTHRLPEHSSVPHNVYGILLKMCAKYQFQLPPNKMNIDDVRLALRQAIDNRYTSLNEIITDLSTCKKRGFFTKVYPFSNQG